MRTHITALALVLTFVGCASKNGTGDDGDDATGDDQMMGDDQMGDDQGGSDQACAAPNAGVDEACLTTDDCTCETTCAARKCVAKSACNEARLTWDAPIQNTDGSCLTDTGGFNVKWGMTMGGPYDNVLDLGMPCVDTEPVQCGEDGSTAPMRECTALLDSLPEGTVYFVMTTYNTDGVESDPSGEASKVVDCP